MEDQNNLITMKKQVNWIENQGENLFKMHQYCQMAIFEDFVEKLCQL